MSFCILPPPNIHKEQNEEIIGYFQIDKKNCLHENNFFSVINYSISVQLLVQRLSVATHKPLRAKSPSTRTTAGLLKVVAAIGELETRVVAVARLVANRTLVDRRNLIRFLLNDAARVPALATELRGAAAAGGGPVNGQGNQRGDDDQPGQPGRVLPPHSPRDSATLTTLLSPPPATTMTLGCRFRRWSWKRHARAVMTIHARYFYRNWSRARSIVVISIYRSCVLRYRPRISSRE
jgi:hypothetical protein